MTVTAIDEHDNRSLKPATVKAIAAALAGADVSAAMRPREAQRHTGTGQEAR